MLLIISLILIFQKTFYCFNLSPDPNFVITEPKTMNNLRSSYFGLSLNLRKGSIFIGAPRAQSTLQTQRDINETGAIYKCEFKSTNITTCYSYNFENQGNIFVNGILHDWNDERRDYQWLGASMDGDDNNNNPLVVCAPRMQSAQGKNSYGMNGICYFTVNTLKEQPEKIMKISPLTNPEDQTHEDQNNQTFYEYMLAQEGLSVHWIGSNNEIVIGAPGINDGSGSIIRYNFINETSDIPNPDLWHQPSYSYFGYSVSSGIFYTSENQEKLLYIASAPKKFIAEVYLFEIFPILTGKTTRKHGILRGQNFGEYFGYTIVTDDINGDNRTDIIVSAPMYGYKSHYEIGAIYVFLNTGDLKKFTTQLIISPSINPGRFGTTLAKLGDINHDGYNDLAIGAPFDGNGLVYIYLGSSSGLQMKPSQILKAPVINSLSDRHMFGHGLSKGVDIDSNEFSDLAIGAPNADTVYIYRAYPVIGIKAYIRSKIAEIKTDQSYIPIEACYKTERTLKKINSWKMNMNIIVDEKYQRFLFNNNNITIKVDNITVSNKKSCQKFNLTLNTKSNLMKYIFEPGKIIFTFDLMDKITEMKDFCETCAVLNTTKNNFVEGTLKFHTMCEHAKCIADMEVAALNFSSTTTLGKSEKLSISLNIINKGEIAYLPQLTIKSSNELSFAKIPSDCNENMTILTCDLFKGQQMLNGTNTLLRITFDISKITEPCTINLTVQVFSASDEKNISDNILIKTIKFIEFSNIETIGSNNKPIHGIKDLIGWTNFTNKISIRNFGPSFVKEAEIIISIPVSFVIPKLRKIINLIDIRDFNVTGNYSVDFITYNLNQKQFLNLNQISIINKLNFVNLSDTEDNDENQLHLTKRSINSVEESESTIRFEKHIHKTLIDNLLENQTKYFNCNNLKFVHCLQAKFIVSNFRPIPQYPITVYIKFSINLRHLEEILDKDIEYFVVTPDIQFNKIGDENCNTINIYKNMPLNIIRIIKTDQIPIWIYVVSINVGILLLIFMIYGLYKFGFFKRLKKEEMEKYSRNSLIQLKELQELDDILYEEILKEGW